MSEDIRRLARHARRAEKFPTTVACADCGVQDIRVLVRTSTPIRCYQCDARRRGLSGLEMDHIIGRNNSDITVGEAGNDHRILSDMQEDWPMETLQNPNGNPLIMVAASLRRLLDKLKYYIDTILGAMPAAIEVLNGCLTALHGERWWEKAEFSAFTNLVRAVCHG